FSLPISCTRHPVVDGDAGGRRPGAPVPERPRHALRGRAGPAAALGPCDRGSAYRGADEPPVGITCWVDRTDVSARRDAEAHAHAEARSDAPPDGYGNA